MSPAWCCRAARGERRSARARRRPSRQAASWGWGVASGVAREAREARGPAHCLAQRHRRGGCSPGVARVSRGRGPARTCARDCGAPPSTQLSAPASGRGEPGRGSVESLLLASRFLYPWCGGGACLREPVTVAVVGTTGGGPREGCRDLLARGPGVKVVGEAGRRGTRRWRCSPRAAPGCRVPRRADAQRGRLRRSAGPRGRDHAVRGLRDRVRPVRAARLRSARARLRPQSRSTPNASRRRCSTRVPRSRERASAKQIGARSVEAGLVSAPASRIVVKSRGACSSSRSTTSTG